MPEQPYFSVEAHCHGTLDQDAGLVPQWSDLSVEINTDPPDPTKQPWAFKTEDGGIRLALTRNAGEVLIDVIYSTLHPYAGRSIGQIMERQLDEVVERLMTKQAEEGDVFLARGMAMAIACMYNPLAPDWEVVRDDAVSRYTNTH